MNILVLCDGFIPEHTGGICRSLHTEVVELAERGHSLTVLTRRHTVETSDQERHPHYRLIRHMAPIKGTSGYYLHPWSTMRNVPAVLRELAARERFDVAYVHNTFHAAALAKSAIGVRTVWSFHAPAPVEIALDAEQGKYGWKTPVARAAAKGVERFERSTLRTMDKVIVRSEFMRGQIESLYPGACEAQIVPLCVDTERFKPATERAAVREELGIPTDRPILFTVRRLVGRMGLENLLRAMPQVLARHPRAMLLIAGKGYLQSSLNQLAADLNLADSVRFLGFVNDDELPRYYQAADLFVLPTAQLEGFGLVTLESISSGTPVVATPVGANPDIVGGLDRRLLAADATSEGIASALNRWIANPELEELRGRSRAHCERLYSRRSVGDALEDVFKGVGSEVARIGS